MHIKVLAQYRKRSGLYGLVMDMGIYTVLP